MINALVTLFTTTDLHATLFGLGEMGKSSVALNVAHHPEIKNKFAQRLFYKCHTDKSVADLTVGLLRLLLQQEPPGGNKHDTLLDELTKSTIFLMIDNFESVWYEDANAENFIGELATISTLTLLVTARPRSFDCVDVERGINLFQLVPVEYDASRDIFLKPLKNDRYAADPSLSTLLGPTMLAGYPLTIKLVANSVANAVSLYNTSRKSSLPGANLKQISMVTSRIPRTASQPPYRFLPRAPSLPRHILPWIS